VSFAALHMAPAVGSVPHFVIWPCSPLEKKKMKRTWITAGIMLLLLLPVVYAQTSTMDSASEKSVQITSGPTITNNTGNAATMHWTTNKAGANHVKYREAGSGNWQSAYHAGGGTDHTLQLTGLQPGKNYEYQILTRDGDIRTSGQFQMPATAGGTVNVSSTSPATAPSTPGAPATTTAPKVPLYRFVGTNGQHVYSTSTSAPSGFRQEGVAGYVLQSQAADTAPLYMLTNPNDAMLSTSASEGGMQGSQVGYIATSQQPGTQPFYRLLDKSGHHFATASPEERAQALASGMKDDGTLGYIWQSQ
jgi:Purple acid Phosphatase, N-terminal domain/Repeat of unknown function (DUF5648)